ncbi:hypothetical protein Dda_1643 [Drechslerella dactyloides]|uniref:Tail specific protease domain-containing protein n=1 Tax=Drechslerella dactyloides TaxID=74499 RepID=A0AAD6J230_DREDA|nr:hypothetical protein Dda_1643 [Drechslerella dactyloides]
MIVKTTAAALLGLGCTFADAVSLPQIGILPAASIVKRQAAPAKYVPTEDDLSSGCANIARVAASFGRTSEAGSATAFPVDAKIAYDCLASIPLDKDAVLLFLNELKKFVQFQSTLEYLARPPSKSGQDPMDLLGGLTDIGTAVNSGSITSWNDVETRAEKLLDGCHEGHLYVTWPLPSLISFRAPFQLVSMSSDGTQLPKVYVADDAQLESTGNGQFNASAITQIDGQDVVQAIDKLMYYESSQSPDTRWNAAFQSQNPPKQGEFFTRTRYPGANTFVLTFENGTSTEYSYTAKALNVPGQNIWSKLTSGQDVWDKIINVPPAQNSGAAGKLRARALEDYKHRTMISPMDETLRRLKKRQTANNEVPPPDQLVILNGDFPDTPGVKPYIQDINQVVGGYFMADYDKSDDNSKTAIIDVTGFSPDNTTAEFATQAVQAAVEMFLAEAKRRKMERLIIDVRGNGGGYVNMGYDLYKQLFPSSEPYSGTRLRNHPASLKIAQAFTQLVNQEVIDDLIKNIGGGVGANLSVAQAARYEQATFASVSNLDQFLNLDANGTAFKSFGDFFGPVDIYDDQFTHTLTYDLRNLIAVGDLGYSITGYGDRASYANNPDPFKPENIILVTDGVCASTCGIFAEFLRNQQKIRTVVVGGRPDKEPSPAVGGTRGTQVIQHNAHMLKFVEIVEQNFAPRDAAEQAEWDGIFPRPFQLNIPEAAVNWKDNIRKTDPTQTPLQFYLEAADCRLFYTKQTLVYSHELWNRVDDLAWGSEDNCAQGSLKNANVVLGDANGVPVSIGPVTGPGFNSGANGDLPQLTGDYDVDTALWIWYGVRYSIGSSRGRTPA